jgi:hypothetical protein
VNFPIKLTKFSTAFRSANFPTFTASKHLPVTSLPDGFLSLFQDPPRGLSTFRTVKETRAWCTRAATTSGSGMKTMEECEWNIEGLWEGFIKVSG